MRIGLYGIYGVYNFGCEAIVRGTFKFLKDCYPNCQILYFSYSYEYDSKMLSDLDLSVIAVKPKKSFAKRLLNKGLSVIRSEHRMFTFDANEIINKVDLIVSIGGDMYTIPAVLRELRTYPYYNPIADFCGAVQKQNKHVIVYGASMGPWGDYDRAVKYYVRNISKYDCVICREHVTLKYLSRLGLSNCTFLPDPAFLVKDALDIRKTEDCSYIGLNLSPLSLRELYGGVSEEQIVSLTDQVVRILDTFEDKILLIPHVLSSDKGDNDQYILKTIIEQIPQKYKDRVHLAHTDGGFLGIKKQLRECKFIVSARMHCAINAIVECRPAIFLSYSQKSQGMCQYVYGSKKWIISIKDMDIGLVPLMREMNEQAEELSSYLVSRNEQIVNEYQNLIAGLHLYMETQGTN